MPSSNMLPEEVVQLAHKTRNGELAWKKNDIPQVLAACVTLNLAVPDGEIWVVRPDGRYSGDVPSKEGGSAGIYTWNIARDNGESWTDFVRRAARYTQEAIRTMTAEEWTKPEIVPMLRYNLTIDDENTYNELRASVP